MEGVKRYEVKLVPHKDAWDEEYRETAAMLREVWGDDILDIQHVGSTAIPSIKAKPILDVAVRLRSMQEMKIDALTAKGYEYCGPHFGDEEYQVFVLRSRGEEDLSLHHIHVYGPKEPGFDQLIGFRDWLNTHPEDAAEYERIKISLSEAYAAERSAYTKGKGSFILSIYEKLK
ncbi:MAG: GrpB family protein [Oscillospiraceae bacterium]|nr:GrpB family protein [Oscillospiraceae bacterium]